MLIYVAMFALSSIFLYLSRRVKGKKFRKLCVIIALLLPSLLAAFRATSIGTDYGVYGTTFFNFAKNSSGLLDYFATMSSMGYTDYGCCTLIYLSSLVSDEYILEMFLFQIITVVFIYLGLCKCEERYGTPVWLAMLLYYFAQYNSSLNVMRQSIAVALAFYAFTCIWEKKYVKYVIFMLLAFTMHSSTLLAVALLILYKFLQGASARTEKKQIIRGMVIVVLIAGVSMGLSNIVDLLVNIGVISGNFASYLSGGLYSYSSIGGAISLPKLANQTIYMVAFALYYRNMNRKQMDALFFTMDSLLVFIIYVFSPFFAKYVYRMAYYFVPLQMVGLSNIALLNKKESRKIWNVLIIFVAFAFWFILTVWYGENATVPYEFYWS